MIMVSPFYLGTIWEVNYPAYKAGHLKSKQS